MNKLANKKVSEKISKTSSNTKVEFEEHSNSLKKEHIYLTKHTKRIFISLAMCLPIFAWLLGSLINPSGWASKDPSIIGITLFYIPIYFWYITIPLIIILVALRAKWQTNIMIIAIFSISFVASLYILATTISASESEFTG